MEKKIITVFKTHFDIGFTELARELMKRYSGKMLRDILVTCRSTSDRGDKKFIWTFAAWVFLQTLANAEEKDRKEAIELIKNGQMKIHALPFTMHTEFLGLEELNRVCNYAKKAKERYGIEMPIAAKMTDVPGHTHILPTILANAGVKFLHLGVNSASKPVDLPLLFWWEGPDGSRVLTFYNKGGYGSDLMPPKDWEFPVWLALVQSNDNIGPQSPEIVENLEKKIHAVLPDTKMVVGTMDDFYREISRCDLSRLPVIRSDFADTWIHGVGSYPKEVASLRRNRNRVCALQTLASLKGLDVRDIVEEIYENAILFGEHTWGLDVKTTLGYARSYDKQSFLKERASFDSYKRIEESWEEQRSRAKAAVSLTDRLQDLVEGAFLEKNSDCISVFNPEAAEKDGFVDVSGCVPQGRGLSCGGKGVKILQSAGKTYAHLHLKPLEFQILKIEETAESEGYSLVEKENCLTIIGDEITVSVDKNSGAIVLLTDAATGKNYCKGCGYEYEIVSSNAIAEYIRAYSYRFYDWSVNDFGRLSYPVNFAGAEFKPTLVRAMFEGDSIVCEYVNSEQSVREYGNAVSLRVVYTVLGKALNVRVSLQEKQATPYVEGGSFVFDLNLTNPEYTINKVGTLLDPARDIAKDANNKMYCMENFVDITDGEKSIAVLSQDAPLFSIGESAVYKFKGEYESRSDAKIYINLFNNQWGTNFPQWMEGDYTYEFALLPHQGDISAVSDLLYSFAVQPLVMSGRAAVDTADFLQIEGGKLIAVFDSKDGRILRIREDKKKKGTIRLIGKLTDGKLYRANSFGEPMEPCGREFETNPMQIHTILIKK